MIVENPGNRLVDKRGKPIAIADGSEEALGLRHLHTGASHEGERLDEVGNEDAILRDAVHLQADARLADRVYGRVREQSGSTYLQYWLWFYYNPKDVAGRGRHVLASTFNLARQRSGVASVKLVPPPP